VFAKSLKLPFPILSDWPENNVIKAYDIWHPERYTARRTTYVIDMEGIIRGVIESETDMTVHSRDSLRIVQELEGKR
jgi:peroxiredoxin